ncbi:hypothetical protein DOY81_005078, partial [Sarcophaga bullata]
KNTSNMSCGYLYEIRRKSEDYEQHLEQCQRENSNLSEFSKDEEIWEVPEENFDNVYQQIGYNEELTKENEDEVQEDEIRSTPEVLNLRQFENTETIRLSLSSEQIALKSQSEQTQYSMQIACNEMQQIINKSINTETDLTKSMTSDNNAINAITTTTAFNTTTVNTTTTNNSGNKVQWKNLKLTNNNNNNNNIKTNDRHKHNSSSSSLLNFSIVPINVSAQNQKKTTEKELEKFPEIKLTSFSARTNSIKLPAPKATILKPNSGFYAQTTISSMSRRKSSGSGSEVNKHITESSTSPESLLDNILSAASSVSVHSSSQSSNGLAADLDAQKIKQNSKSREKSLQSMTLPTNVSGKYNTGILKNQIPELKIITTPNTPSNTKTLNIGKNTSPSLLTISNLSHSDSFETASNRSR